VAPFHPLRHDARVRVARALASVATFLAIALVLLGGNANGPLASAEADEGAPSAAASAPPPEPVAVAAEPVVQAEAPPPKPAAQADPPPPEPAPVTPTPVPEIPAPEPSPEPSGQDAPPLAQDPLQEQEPPLQGQEPPPSEIPPGGGSKEEAEEPEEPETPPILPSPARPAPDPGRAPTGNARPSVFPGKPGSEAPAEVPTPSGANKEAVEEAEAAPEPAGVAAPSPPPPAAPVPQSPAPPQISPNPALLNEGGSRAKSGGRIIVGPAGRSVGGGDSGGTRTDPGAGTGGGAAPGATLGATATPTPVDVAAVLSGVSGDSAGDADSSAPKDELISHTGGGTDQAFGPVFASFGDALSFVPDEIKVALALLAALSILLGLAYLLSALRNRRLERQRGELLKEVGLLQTALLPPVPERVGALRTSVAYRPADGPGAGGDFYDVLPLAGGRVGFILGDVSGHGRGALARTAFMRYTLRAYLEAGLEPRVALQVAGRVIDENLGGDFATVLLAVHDPETGSLTYASAGHPAPIVVGPQAHDPVTAGSSPPIGVGVRTGLRQTTVPLVPGAVAALFTDGLMEARVNGGILGRERLETMLEDLGPDVTAAELIAGVREEVRTLSDDIAAVVIQPTAGPTAGMFRTEQLELTARELDGPIAARFLESCGVPKAEAMSAIQEARGLAERFGGVILHVVFGNRLRVEVLPRNMESIEAASHRAAATR
jgi:serine phosphatase RsbU (regulator of sigma subunit)